MPSRVPPSSIHTRCRNPASVCSSSTGSDPSSRRYHSPLTSTFLTVSATWVRPGKLDNATTLSVSLAHVPEIHLVAEHPQPLRDDAVGQPKSGQQPLEPALLACRPGQLHVRAELRRQKACGGKQIQPAADHPKRPRQERHARDTEKVLAHR